MQEQKQDASCLVRAFVGCCLVAAATPAPACFTILSANDRVIYHAAAAPVDMSRPLHETLPFVSPGAHLVFDLQSPCGPLVDDEDRPLRVSVQQGVVVRVASTPERAFPVGAGETEAGASWTAAAAGWDAARQTGN